MSLELLLALSAIVNRLIEAIKPLLEDIPIPAKWRGAFLVIISAVLGAGAAFLFDMNLFADSGVARLEAWAGVLLTGILIGLGANAIHAFSEVVNLIRRRAPASTNSSATVTVETTGGGKASANMVTAVAPPALDPNAVG